MKLILQHFGLGDIILSMSAIRSLNDRILWPVLPEYVEGCNYAYPDISFISWQLLTTIDFACKDRYFIQDMEVIPLRWQDSPVINCAKNKYTYFGLDYRTWKANAKYKRNYPKENKLMKQLNIDTFDQFNLVCMKFGCQTDPNNLHPEAHETHFNVNNGLRNVEMKMIDGYSLFDWSSIIERAATIHTVSTSNFYLLELLRTGAKEIHLYPRIPHEKDFRRIDYLFTKPYILH